MGLIISSFAFGLLGAAIGMVFKNIFFMCAFGIVGFFSPMLYVLDSIYKELVVKDKK